MKKVARMHKNPLKSAGFKVLKAPDVPSVLIELGYVSSKDDLKQLTSGAWQAKTAGAIGKAIDNFFSTRLAGADRRAGRPMTGKPQFDHKNPRFFAAQGRSNVAIASLVHGALRLAAAGGTTCSALG